MKKLFLFFLLSVLPLAAQTDRASLTGTVTDPSGRMVADADLSIKSRATGLVRQTKTNGAGVYTVSSLETGTYDVTVQAGGFSVYNAESVHLDVGQTRTLDATLSVAGEVTQVEVTDAGLAKSSVEIGGVVNGREAADLPLNGRSYVGLVSLVPGVIDGGTGTQQDVRFAGLSDEDNTWHLDGVDNSGINHQYNKVDLHLQVSTEAISEFRANGVTYSADQGGSVGGQIELVSKTGGAEFHGAAWEFLRNNYFDATPYHAAGLLPALRRNNFGANLGGPLVKDKLFFFANYESVREILDQPLTGTVPSQAFKNTVATQQPVLVPLINAFPTGQIPISATTATWNGNGRQTTREDSGLMRVDYHISDRMSAFIRFSTDVYSLFAPDGLAPSTAFTNVATPNATIGVQNTFSSRFLNDFRYGFNRDQFSQGQNTPFAFALTVSPFTAIGNPSGSIRNDNSFTVLDDATFLAGRSTIKAGVTVRRIQENKASPNSPNETITYSSTADFLNNLIDSDNFAGTVPVTGQRMTEYFGYVLDQYKLSRTVNLNVGLRYEYFGVDHEVLGRGVLVDPLNCPNVICPQSQQWYSPNLADFSPRIGATWAPSVFNDKMVIRAGFGIYYGFGQFGGLSAPISNLTSAKYNLTQSTTPGLSYPVPPTAGTVAGSASPSGSPINRRDTAVDEWSLSIQQEIFRKTIFQISYFGTSVSHAFSDWTLNGNFPGTTMKPYPAFGTIDYRGTFNHGNTHALQASIQRNVSRDLQFAANYEWSHSIDNGGIGGGEADIAQNQSCLTCERSSSDQDMRHYFTARGIWQIPVGRGRHYLSDASRPVDFLLGGWQFAGIASARSGLPVNITVSRSASTLPDLLNKNQRPNLVPGQSIYAPNKNRFQWLNYAAFSNPAAGTWGDLGRNAARAPGIWQFDPAISKRFPVTHRVGVIFRAEAFNVFNVAQYGKPVALWVNGGNSNNFGTIQTAYSTNTSGSGVPRELEFSLKAEF